MIKKRIIIIVCSVALLCTFGLWKKMFIKSLFHLNTFNCDDSAGDVKSELIFTKDGYVMNIYGEGDMSEYPPQDWTKQLQSDSAGWIISLKKANIHEGVTSISNFLFAGSGKLYEVSIPVSIEMIGIKAFAYCSDLKTIHFAGTLSQFRTVMDNSPDWNGESNIQSVECSDGRFDLFEGGEQ